MFRRKKATSTPLPTIEFQPMSREIEFSDEESILDVALKHNLDLGHSCGGMGSCTTCRILIESPLADLPPRNEVEREMATMKGFADSERLACQLRPQAGLKVRIP